MTAQVYSHSANIATLTVACPAGRAAIGGGARRGTTQTLQAVYPVTGAATGTTAGTIPTDGQTGNGYTAIFSAASATNRVFVVCGP